MKITVEVRDDLIGRSVTARVAGTPIALGDGTWQGAQELELHSYVGTGDAGVLQIIGDAIQEFRKQALRRRAVA